MIHVILASDLSMLGTINRVSKTFKDCATVALTNRWPQLHMSEPLVEALRLLPKARRTREVVWGKAPRRCQAPLPPKYGFTRSGDSISRLPMHHVADVSACHTKSSRTTIEACSAVLYFRRFFL